MYKVLVTDKLKICCSLNEYFTTIGKNLSDEISSDNEDLRFLDYIPENTIQRKYYFMVVNRLKILNIIDKSLSKISKKSESKFSPGKIFH